VPNMARLSAESDQPLRPAFPGCRLLFASALLFLLTGCGFQLSFQPEAAQTPYPSTPVRLPDTWTPLPATNTAQPTQAPTPTDTLEPTQSDLPTSSVLAAASTWGESKPHPTIDYLSEPYPDCRYFAAASGVRLLLAPFIDPYRALPTMEVGKAYQAVVDQPTFTLLFDNGQPAGWVDYRLIAIKMEGADCLSRRDDRLITDYPGLCLFTPLEETEVYSSLDLDEPTHIITPPFTFVVLLQYQHALFSAYGSDGPSFYVSRDAVSLSGNCGDVPAAGTVLQPTKLYSLPDSGSSPVVDLVSGQTVAIQAASQNGPAPPGLTGSGKWLQVRVPAAGAGYEGWCWSDFLALK
jgi:hypothetical protein